MTDEHRPGDHLRAHDGGAETPTALAVSPAPSRRDAIASALSPPFRVVPAEGGLDGLNRLREAAVDCVVVDLDLQDVPVVGLVDRLRDDQASVPVVLLGDPADPNQVVRGFRAGACDHVGSPGDLLESVERAVAARLAATALDRHRRTVDLLGRIARDVTGAPDQAAIERAVYDRLASADLYRFVCIGDYAPETGEFAIRLPVEGSFPEPPAAIQGTDGVAPVVERAVGAGEVATADGRPTTRGDTASADERSGQPLRIAAVPFVHGGSTYGVALLVAPRREAFEATERDALGELGAIVGAALCAASGHRPSSIPPVVENLVHEIRSPLGIAMAHLEIARDQDDPASFERVREALEQIESLLGDVSKMAAPDRIDLTTRRDFGETAAAAWRALDEPEAELAIEATAPVAADHDLLERVLSNLFRNAIEHGGDDVTVHVGTTADGFFVEDDGSGIPAAARDRVFERGYSSTDGSGIGLSLVHDIAAAHGWSVELGDGGSGGARFEVTGVDVADDDGQTGS